MPRLSLVTFNAHLGTGPGRLGQTPYDLVGVLRGFDADVIVVQESWAGDDEPGAVQKVAAELGSELHEVSFGRGVRVPFPRYDTAGNGTVGIAVLSRHPVLETDRIPLRPVPRGSLARRRALRLRLDVDGSALDLVAVHLSSRVPQGPVSHLLDLRPHLPSRDRPAVVAGDCNFWGPTVVSLLPGWRRAVRGRTWPARRPHSQIDHILVTPRIRVVESAVLDPVGSDHRPIRAVLEWDPRD